MIETPDQEADVVPRGPLRIAVIVIVVMIVLSVIATLVIGRGGLGEVVPIHSRAPGFLDRELFAGRVQGEELQRQARERLRSYGWVDQPRGIVHIPIEVAIEQALQETQR